ncbi:restriction endonuclease [Phenylobacterium sp.]|uniref:restriction endonuclease n=1 Tax=Phenylobacterium sp. TaxID=1871053 RepID=UPI00271F35BF|nr:restriction endonuclease [Phenylobacterium sp.]MDO8801717.1 restriction endonuclease [Phenylobacterium sp.]
MRLPSFNDFSPGIIGDVRQPLLTLKRLTPDFDAVVAAWASDFFNGADNKRASTNIPASLTSLGLFDRKTRRLTPEGELIASAGTPLAGAEALSAHVVATRNGMMIIEAVRALNRRAEPVSKVSLKRELQLLGVEGLSAATTDHTTLLNWMAAAGLLDKSANYMPIDSALKRVLGVSSEERAEIAALPLEQQIFLKILRRLAEAETTHTVPAKFVTDECLRDYSVHFDEDQLSKKVLRPLEMAGWIALTARTEGRGAKSGMVTATAKLLEVPFSAVVPDFDEVVPADLRDKIDLPRSEIQRLLTSEATYDRGLGLELLALRMLIDLGLQPRSFRQRSKDTAYAEVDLTAEGTQLLFSRWNVQCKCVKTNVGLGDVAKEVGLAIYGRSHVVAVVTTSDFSREAINYAREITVSTHLQFLLINGAVVKAYLENGPASLHAFVARNAGRVMTEKRQQPINPTER